MNVYRINGEKPCNHLKADVFFLFPEKNKPVELGWKRQDTCDVLMAEVFNN